MDMFEIPLDKNELEIEEDKNSVISNLKDARANSTESPEFIADYCKAYFSLVYFADDLASDVIFRGYEDLHKAVKKLSEKLKKILESLNEETRLQYLNILKILLYCYTQVIIAIEQQIEAKSNATNALRQKKSKKDNTGYNFDINKKEIVINLNNIALCSIGTLWEPPIPEEVFINMVSEVCYRFLQNPGIKNEKEVLVEIWNFLGNLILKYNHGKTFIIRTVQLIKLHEHLVQILPECFKFLVDNFNSKGIIHEVIKEVTEWQTEESYVDSKGAKSCSLVLVEMAVLMPDLMIPEFSYLDTYLNHESPTLRNSVLSVIAEILLKVLTRHSLTEEEKELRDEFLFILMEHMDDVAAVVRAKVIQHWTRLQKENAIPRKSQCQVLAKIVRHLHDKGALVRKSAINCVTAFLAYNSFSANLQLSKLKEELARNEEILHSTSHSQEIKELEENWNTKREEIKKLIAEDLLQEYEPVAISSEDILGTVRKYLLEGNYIEAIKFSRSAEAEVPEFKELGDAVDNENKVELLLMLLKSVYVSPKNNMTEDDLKQWEKLQTDIEFLENAIAFLTLIDDAIELIVDLLDTTSVSDMNEAIEFFISAYQFNIDNRMRGVSEMLRLMQRNEPERKKAVIEAFKTIYLNTDAGNLQDHTTQIVNRLIYLVKTVPINNLEDLQLIISDWTGQGVIDNSIIDMMWKYFTKKAPVSDEDSRAALELLRMAALGRGAIILKNIKLVSTVAFDPSQGHTDDLLFIGSACKMLSVAGREKIDVNSSKTPTKLKMDDESFQRLIEIFAKSFFDTKADYYTNAASDCVQCFFKLSSKPERLCEDLLKNILQELTSKNEPTIEEIYLFRLCRLLDSIVLCHLNYMDNTVYRELKRRNNIRQERSEKNKTKKKQRKNNESMNASSVNEESILEGAVAEDTDAEFILNVLENDTVTGSGFLGKLAVVIKSIAQRPDIYDNEIIQGASVISLIRYMLVSSKFCEENIQLLFTIFEHTKHPEVKCTILLHCSDLLTRFPNIVDPWTPRIFQSLDDPLEKIRKTAFFTLSNLILRDMIRAHGHISAMAKCMVDQSEFISKMSKNFFVQLSHKENNLYNILPDIFSHLLEIEALEQVQFRDIMKFLFELMDKQKYMENLVDRFCFKFSVTENANHCRNIMYCLSLITYNERALKKLLENFPRYKHLLHDDEFYSILKQILTNSSKSQVGKVDLKPIVAEIEQNIEQTFEISEDGVPKKRSTPRTAKKATKKPTKRMKKVQRKQQGSSSDNSD